MPINVTLPPLHEAQKLVRDSDARFKVVAAGRRFGKSRLAMLLCLEVLLTKPGAHVWWCAPIYSQSADAWSDLKTFASQIPGATIREGDRVMRYNGGYLMIKTTSEPDTLRGAGLDFVVLDEAAFMDAATWYSSIRPALSDRKGRALFISSPNGAGNWFHALYLQGQAGDPEWASWAFPTSANPYIDKREIEAAGKGLPALVFAQEYLAEFTSDAGAVFRGVRDCLYRGIETYQAAGSDEVTRRVWDNGTYFEDRNQARRHYAMGVDLAQMSDFSVLTVVDSVTGKVVDIDRFNQVAWSFQRDRIRAMADKWQAAVIRVESNSIGSVNIEELQADGLPVVAFTTTNQSKAEIVQALAYAFETGKIGLPSDHPLCEVLVSELEGFQAERLPSGRWRYGARGGLHDDCVMSLAIAWSGVRQTSKPIRVRSENPIFG